MGGEESPARCLREAKPMGEIASRMGRCLGRALLLL